MVQDGAGPSFATLDEQRRAQAMMIFRWCRGGGTGAARDGATHMGSAVWWGGGSLRAWAASLGNSASAPGGVGRSCGREHPIEQSPAAAEDAVNIANCHRLLRAYHRPGHMAT